MAEGALQDFRAKYPEYDDLSDQQLTDSLHAKFYSDMPREQFEAKLGVTRTSPADNWSNIGAESLGQAGIKPAPRAPEQGGGLLRNFAAGAGEAVTSTLGFLGDLGVAQANAESGYTMFPEGTGPAPGAAASFANRQLGRGGLNPESVPANTYSERVARAAGGGAVMLAAPEVAAARAPSVAANLLRVGRAALTGSAAGAGGQIGSDVAGAVTPERYRPYAEVVGSLAGGGVGALTTEVPRAIGAGGRVAARALGPVTERSAQRTAAERLAASASNPIAARDALNAAPELVPGSQPTTFQASGDMGLGSLEREMQTKFPAEFNQRRADQNAARVGQLQRLQPNGSASDLSDYVRGQVRCLDDQTEQDVAGATRVAQQRVEAMGGNHAPEHYGSELRLATQQAEDMARSRERALWKAVDPSGDLRIDAAPIRSAAHEIRNGVSGSARPIAGDEKAILDIAAGYNAAVPFRDVGDLRSFVSDAMRSELRTNGQTQTYARLSRLRSAIQDAINGAVEVRAQQAPNELYASLSGYGQSLERQAADFRATRSRNSESAGAYDAFGTGGISSAYRGQGQARGGFSDAPRNTRVSGTPLSRSSSLLQTIARMGGIRTHDVSGTVTPEGQEITSLLRDYNKPGLVNNRTGLPPDEVRKLLQDEGWFGRSERFGPTALAAGEHPGDNLQELYDALDREARGQRVYHPEAQASGQRYDPLQHEQYLEERAGRVGVSRLHGWSLKDWEAAITEREAMREESAQPFDQSARQRLNAATQATRERADTFGRGPVGQVLAKAGRQDQYRLGDASVPAKVFHPGASGFEDVQAFRRAIGDDQVAFTALREYAASSLRKVAMRPDGTLDPAKVSAWANRHSEALRAFPELRERFSSASAASEALAEAAATRRAVLDHFQTGALGKLAGIGNPEDVTRAVGGILGSRNRVEQMRELAATARRDPNAMAGLRRSVADYIQGRFISNTEAATSGQGLLKSDAFQTFMRENEAALRSVFNADEIGSLKAIAADLQRANRSIAAIRLPGQSNTAQDLAQLAKAQPSILRRLLVEGAAAAGGWFTAGGAGTVVGWLGAKTVGALRDSGMQRVNDLLREAMLDPELARALLDSVPAKPDIGTAARLATALRKGVAVGGTMSATQPQRQSRRDESYVGNLTQSALVGDVSGTSGYANQVAAMAGAR